MPEPLLTSWTETRERLSPLDERGLFHNGMRDNCCLAMHVSDTAQKKVVHGLLDMLSTRHDVISSRVPKLDKFVSKFDTNFRNDFTARFDICIGQQDRKPEWYIDIHTHYPGIHRYNMARLFGVSYDKKLFRFGLLFHPFGKEVSGVRKVLFDLLCQITDQLELAHIPFYVNGPKNDANDKSQEFFARNSLSKSLFRQQTFESVFDELKK